ARSSSPIAINLISLVLPPEALFYSQYFSTVGGNTPGYIAVLQGSRWSISPHGGFSMAAYIDRREFLRLAGLGGVVFASGLGYSAGAATSKGNKLEEFYWVQLSDSHWGFEGPPVNPDAKGTLKKAVEEVNGLSHHPDFVVFTGDLTHTTDDPVERRKRMTEFRDIVAGLNVKTVKFMPGEHDASLDRGKAYQEFFGEPNYTFEHKGIHFIVLDNVSAPAA